MQIVDAPAYTSLRFFPTGIDIENRARKALMFAHIILQASPVSYFARD